MKLTKEERKGRRRAKALRSLRGYVRENLLWWIGLEAGAVLIFVGHGWAAGIFVTGLIVGQEFNRALVRALFNQVAEQKRLLKAGKEVLKLAEVALGKKLENWEEKKK